MHNEDSAIEEIVSEVVENVVEESTKPILAVDYVEIEKRVLASLTAEEVANYISPTPEVFTPPAPRNVSAEELIIGEFVTWLNHEKSIFLAEWRKKPGRNGLSSFEYAQTGIQKLLEEFFSKEAADSAAG